ncbi:MAG: hypothetical protein ACI35S_02000 [Anaeroplasma sp.]
MYLFEKKLSLDEALTLYISSIKDDHRFKNDIDEKLISIEEKCYGYAFYDGFLHNQAYFIKKMDEESSIDGKIDLYISHSSGPFILHNLKKSFNVLSVEQLPQKVENERELKESFDIFINKTTEKLKFDICDRHHITPSRSIHIDIAPIENFDKLLKEYYYEIVYEIHYRDKTKKKDYVSVLSSVTSKFYRFEYVLSNSYMEFLKYFKRPIVHIPKEYIEYYYIDSFKVYESMNEKLNYSKKEDIYKKIRTNIEYCEYSQYKDYLYTGIFYFKIKKYLSKVIIDNDEIKRKIYLCFLTLNFNPESGIFLYKCGLYRLLPDNDIKKLIKYLKISYSLGSMEAKRLLYLHYNSSQYYDLYFVKKYS